MLTCPTATTYSEGMTTNEDAKQDIAWNTAHANAAEALFGKVEGDTLTQEEDDACIAEADAQVADQS